MAFQTAEIITFSKAVLDTIHQHFFSLVNVPERSNELNIFAYFYFIYKYFLNHNLQYK